MDYTETKQARYGASGIEDAAPLAKREAGGAGLVTRAKRGFMGWLKTAAITLGIFVGTYSSVYMAAPILIWLKVNPSSFVPTETDLERQERLAREGA